MAGLPSHSTFYLRAAAIKARFLEIRDGPGVLRWRGLQPLRLSQHAPRPGDMACGTGHGSDRDPTRAAAFDIRYE